MYYKCVKFHKNPISGLGGVALTRYMDGRTDRVIPIYPPPPNFVCGGVCGGYNDIQNENISACLKEKRKFIKKKGKNNNQ